MHLPEAFVDGPQAFADLGEALVELLIQRLGKPVVHGPAHLGQLALVLQAEVVDLFLLVPGGEEDLALHALEEGGLALAHLGEGVHEGLVCVVKRFSRFIMLRVQFIKQFIAEVNERLLVCHTFLFLLVRKRRLTDEQDDQEDQAQ